MGTKVFLSIFICVVLISCVIGYPSKSDSDSNSDEDFSQQQQQNIDLESLEEFTQKIQSTKGRRRKPSEKVQVAELVPEPEPYDPCLDAKKIGPCKAHIPRYFFNKVSGKCELFAWGGCGNQNGNNFRELMDCENTCKKHLQKGKLDLEEPNKDAVIQNCEKPPVPQGGIECAAYIPRWTYNSTEQKCEEFIWGGCPKTENNFATEVVCQQTCGDYPRFKGLIEDVTTEMPSQQQQNADVKQEYCDLPVEAGPCYGYFEKYYFNTLTNRCEPFIYGGCSGNANRFDTVEECVHICGGDEPLKDSNCADVECPWALYDHYTSLGCSPIYDGGSCCPTRFECSDQRPGTSNNTLESRSLTLDKDETTTISPTEEEEQGEITTSQKCRYRGKLYSVGEMVDEASDTGSCRTGCFCADRAGSDYPPSIVCAQIECPEHFGGPPPEKKGCIPLYKKGACCSHDYYCPEEEITVIEPGKQKPEDENPPLAKCESEGESVYEGQRVYPDKSPCSRCLCQRNPNNVTSLEGQLYCEKVDCGIEIHYSTQLARGCAPVYFEKPDGTTSCCPISWECPDEKSDNKGDEEDATSTTPGTMLPEPPKPPSTGTPFPPPPSPPSPLSPNEPSSPLVRTRDACKMEKEEGNCKGHRPRFFYNEITGKCESFIYTGCGSNLNNFASLDDCKQLCEISPGPIPPSPPSKSGKTQGGRGLLSRSFAIDTPVRSQQETKAISLTEVDPCTLPKKVGRCKGYFPRFYYSPEDNECKLFIFGGCRPNANNFYSKDSCEATCLNKIPVANLRTSVPAALAVPTKQRSSNVLDSQGGDASKVNFGEDRPIPTLDVRSRGLPSPPKRHESSEEENPCSLPPRTGRCKAFVRRFYYDSDKKMCKSFTYGGCSGNANNFHTLEDCDEKCSNKIELPTESPTGATEDNKDSDAKDSLPPSAGFTARCKLPKAAGSCHNSIRSYYYDVESKSCKLFFYSGCFGNLNRFSSREDCENLCKKPLESEGSPNEEQPPRVHILRSSSEESSTSTTPSSAAEVFEPSSSRKEFCKHDPAPGNCKESQLRFYYDALADQCLPFVYTGCGGNQNNFITETECISSCGKKPTLEHLAQDMILTCTFGNESVPLGSTVGGDKSSGDEYSGDEIPCGKPVCQCITPPAVTCVQKKCPEPTTTTTEKICATPSCPHFCKIATGEDGCPTCDCDYSKKGSDIEIVKRPAKGSGVKG